MPAKSPFTKAQQDVIRHAAERVWKRFKAEKKTQEDLALAVGLTQQGRVRALLFVLALTACEPTYYSPYVKDGEGRTWRIIKCTTRAACMHRANELCKAGYVDRNELKNPREMMIQCKESTSLEDWHP